MRPERQGAPKVTLLDPELRRTGQLGEHERHHLVPLEQRPLVTNSEVLLCDVPSEDAGVVAEAVHRGGVGRRAVLRHPVRALGRVTRKVDAGRRDALPERRLRGDSPVRDGRDVELGERLERRPEPGRDDHRVGVELELARPGRACRVHAEAPVRPLDPLDRRVDDVRAEAAAHVLVIGLEIPDAERRQRQYSGLHRPRRDERDLPRPGEQSVRQLEARVALADDDHALAVVVGGLARVDVVTSSFGAGNRRQPGLRDAEREHGDLAPIVAFRGLEHQPVGGSAHALELAAVADAQGRSLDVSPERRLHLLAPGNVEAAVHEHRHQPAVLRLVAQQRVVVVPLVFGRLALDRRLRLRPADQPLEDWEAAEHPRGFLVARDDREPPDTRAREAVRGLEAARTAADDHDVVVARWEGPV